MPSPPSNPPPHRDAHSSRGPSPPPPPTPIPTLLHLCPDLLTSVALYVTQVLNVPSGRLAPRNFSFSDIYVLNWRPNTAGSCLLSLRSIISRFQELHSVSESASLSLVSSKLLVTLEEMPRITSASQQCRTSETEAPKHEFMENSGDLIYNNPVIAWILLQWDKKTVVTSNHLLSSPVRRTASRSWCFPVAWVPWYRECY